MMSPRWLLNVIHPLELKQSSYGPFSRGIGYATAKFAVAKKATMELENTIQTG